MVEVDPPCRFLSRAECRPIVDAVLARFEVVIDQPLFLTMMAGALSIASMPGNFEYDILREQAKDHERRCARTAALETLLGEIDLELTEALLVGNEGCDYQGWTDLVLHEEVGRRLADIRSELARLLEVEKELIETSEMESIPNNRPVTSKNFGALEISRILADFGTETWTASKIIAEMLIEAGIEDGPTKRVQRALYDRLRSVR